MKYDQFSFFIHFVFWRINVIHVDADLVFSVEPWSSSAPALSEESVSLGDNTPFHNSGLYKDM